MKKRIGKEYLIREKPKFIISLDAKELEVKNNGIKDFNGKYAYVNINSIEFKKERINWFYFLFGFVLEFFIDGASLFPDKDKDRIIMFYNYKEIEIKLIDCDIQITKKVVKEIQNRI